MKKIIIVTDSCSDLSKDIREKWNIEYLQMSINYGGKEYLASLDWDLYSPKELYDVMRGGTRVLTSQINQETYEEHFRWWAENGYDILSISCSSALSSSVKNSYLVRDKLKTEFPEAKVYCIDALNSCLGEGLMTVKAAQMRDEGKTIDEIAEYIEKNKLKVWQVATVDDLTYLKRAGRVTAASAVFGGMLQIKPILISDAKGQNFPIEKVRGHKAAVKRIVELVKEHIVNSEEQIIYLGHADCIDYATEIKEMLLSEVKCKGIYLNYIGPIIGSSTGPGTIGVYFVGDEVTENA